MNINKLFFSAWKAALVILLFGVLQDYASAQSCTYGGGVAGDSCSMQAEYQVEWATLEKCGYYELCSPSTPPKRYLQEVTLKTRSVQATYDGLNNSDAYYEHEVGSYHASSTNIYNTNDCSQTSIYSGSGTCTDHLMAADYTYGPITTDQTTTGTDTLDPSTGLWEGGSTKACADYFAEGFSPPSTNLGSASQCTPVLSTSSTRYAGAYYSGVWYDTITTSSALSHEYTDAMLRNNTIAIIPAFTDDWLINDSTDNRVLGYAAYYLDDNHYNDWCFRMEYRFRLFGVKDVTYTVDWYEITIYLDATTAPSIAHLSQDVTCTGDPAGDLTPVPARVVEPPSQQSYVFAFGWSNKTTVSGTGGNLAANN